MTLTYPDANWGADLSLLVSSVVAGEWGDSGALERCRLVHVDWPDGLPGPAHEAPDHVLVGAIVKPALGLSPREAAATAGELAAGGADLVKDDELIGDRPWSPLEERVRAIVAAIPEHVAYVANVTGSADGLLRRAERAVELGAKGLLVNAWAQGFDAVRVLRERDLGASVFAHRAGGAPWLRGTVGAGGGPIASLTRMAGSDYVLVGSFTGKLADDPADVQAAIAACHAPAGVPRAVAVLGGGVSPDNAAAQVERAGTRSGRDGVARLRRLRLPRRRARSGRRDRGGGPVSDPIPPTIELVGAHVRLIDQRLLPGELVMLECRTVDELCDAINTLAVRGAPALGAAGAMGIALATLTGEPSRRRRASSRRRARRRSTSPGASPRAGCGGPGRGGAADRRRGRRARTAASAPTAPRCSRRARAC